MPVVVGGTGMYIDCILRNYGLVPMPDNPQLRAELETKSYVIEVNLLNFKKSVILFSLKRV